MFGTIPPRPPRTRITDGAANPDAGFAAGPMDKGP